MRGAAILNTPAPIASQKLKGYWVKRGFKGELWLLRDQSAEWIDRLVFYAGGS